MHRRHHFRTIVLSMLLVTACTDSGTPQIEEPDPAAIQSNNRAVGLMGRFEYEQARDQFEALVEQWPGWNEVRVNLAIATLNRQGDGDEARALQIVQDVLEDDPGHLRARYMAGLVQLYLGEPGAAQEAFRAVAEADPDDAFAAYYLAQCSAQLGDYENALPQFRRALALNPYLRSAYYGAFQSLQRLGRQDEASALAADYQRLEGNPRSQLAEFKYTRMGPKGSALAVNTGGEGEAPAAPLQGALFTQPST
ncbi:MAG: tetratricopeptide repeat protein, partial [Xanthomonadales bacterium]|nr:tetratricopeptide repeat protein [Xanthomonadales bacterium]